MPDFNQNTSQNMHRIAARQRYTRRSVAAILGGLGVTLATPALAQFRFSFGGKDSGGTGGFALNLDTIFDTLQKLFDDLGEDDELQFAETLYPKFLERSSGIYPNDRVQAAIRRFAAPIFATTKRSRFSWDIAVTNDNSVNAWAAPGGKLAINKGLLRYLAEPSELAAVIAHEMAHAEFSHGLEIMKKKKFSDGLSEAVGAAIAQQQGGGMAGSMVSQKAMEKLEGPIYKLVTSGYSQDFESAADAHIMTVFRSTGHDPSQAANPFKILLAVTPEDESAINSLLSSHPETRERIAAIEQMAAGLAKPAAAVPQDGFSEIKQSFPTRKRIKQ
jgi:beta-barrel assembly-enhancing protease